MSLLFSPLTLRGVTARNRAWVSPMCMYSSEKGRPSDWHLVHLGSFARGGAGLVMQEATAVVPEGRISPEDAGIWNDAQAEGYARINRFIHDQGAVTAIQLAHAGRKGSTYAPFRGKGSVPADEGGWKTVAPSAAAFGRYDVPAEIPAGDIPALVQAWVEAAQRAVAAGFDVIEVHAAHGYLLHEFLSPVSNLRTDAYGGDLEGRSRLLVEIVDAVRAVIPDSAPLLVRVSATDWVPNGLDVEEVAQVAATLKGHGVDLIDVSSGGNHPDQKITLGPGYQVPFAARIKQVSGLPTAAVGLITEPRQAEQVLAEGSADAVLLARALLREPSWPLRAAHELGDHVEWPPQYDRGRFPQ
ncbi:NADH:flavin oxidoreductase/NADH oxidase [Kineosporia babensis]|uniref:NADH:flavin oxidoreductase/NADH oxidase n=1 Tax=Kineosporia babensis TaxID=499548 RepID=A0A9X1NF26_9ACTN|nr:NADH:flavin oxidoreductase/NADH oxidase [Kineosporia babensis]MCD5312890.1 NADH:flavin oxidoreductase/NADH oxidase [Kineosporia babensis]